MGKTDGQQPKAKKRTPIKRLHHAVDWLHENAAWVPALVNAVSVLASAFLFAFAGDWPDDVNWPFVVAGGVCTVISIGLTALIETWRRLSREGEVEEGTQLYVTVSDALQPLIREVAKMPPLPSRSRERILVKVLGQVGTSLKLVLPDKPRIRIVVFRVRDSKSGLRELFVESSVGRKDVPKRFVQGDHGRGDEVFEWLEEGEAKFVADIMKSATPPAEKKSYRTYISAPIVAGEKAYGMLTVDSPEPGDLDATDVPVIFVMASVLALAFADADR